MTTEAKVDLPKNHPFTDFISSLPPNSTLRPDHIEYGTGQRYMFSFVGHYAVSRLRKLIEHVQESTYYTSVISSHHTTDGTSMGIFMFHAPYSTRITRPPAEILAEEAQERIEALPPIVETPDTEQLSGIEIQERY